MVRFLFLFLPFRFFWKPFGFFFFEEYYFWIKVFLRGKKNSWRWRQRVLLSFFNNFFSAFCFGEIGNNLQYFRYFKKKKKLAKVKSYYLWFDVPMNDTLMTDYKWLITLLFTFARAFDWFAEFSRIQVYGSSLSSIRSGSFIKKKNACGRIISYIICLISVYFRVY